MSTIKRRKQCSDIAKGLKKSTSAAIKASGNSQGDEAAVKPWFAERRIVELGVLASGLAACTICQKSLELRNIVSERRYGLASLLRVRCECGTDNKISTGKTHRSSNSRRGTPIFDVNTKVATGIVLIHSLKF